MPGAVLGYNDEKNNRKDCCQSKLGEKRSHLWIAADPGSDSGSRLAVQSSLGPQSSLTQTWPRRNVVTVWPDPSAGQTHLPALTSLVNLTYSPASGHNSRQQQGVDARRRSPKATPPAAFPERPLKDSCIPATSPSSWAEISCLGNQEVFVLFYFKCTVPPQAAPPSVLIPLNLFILELYFWAVERGTGRQVWREADKMRDLHQQMTIECPLYPHSVSLLSPPSNVSPPSLCPVSSPQGGVGCLNWAEIYNVTGVGNN